MSKTHFQFNLCKLQVPLKELVETIINTNFLKLRSRNCVIKSLVNKEQKKKGKSQSFNFLSILATHNEYTHENEIPANCRKSIYTNMWIFDDSLTKEKLNIYKMFESILTFLKEQNISSVQICLLPDCNIERSRLPASSLRRNYTIKTYENFLQNQLLRRETKVIVNDVILRYYSSCDKERSINPRLEHFRLNRDKYPSLCKYCRRGPPYKRRKPKSIFSWICSFISSGKNKDPAKEKNRCCNNLCKHEVHKSRSEEDNLSRSEKTACREKKKSDVRETTKIAPSSSDSNEIKSTESSTEFDKKTSSKTDVKRSESKASKPLSIKSDGKLKGKKSFCKTKLQDDKLNDLSKKYSLEKDRSSDKASGDNGKSTIIPCVDQRSKENETEKDKKNRRKPCIEVEEEADMKNIRESEERKTDVKDKKQTTVDGVVKPCSKDAKMTGEYAVNFCKTDDKKTESPKTEKKSRNLFETKDTKSRTTLDTVPKERSKSKESAHKSNRDDVKDQSDYMKLQKKASDTAVSPCVTLEDCSDNQSQTCEEQMSDDEEESFGTCSSTGRHRSYKEKDVDDDDCIPLFCCDMNVTECVNKAVENLCRENEEDDSEKRYQLRLIISECSMKRGESRKENKTGLDEKSPHGNWDKKESESKEVECKTFFFPVLGPENKNEEQSIKIILRPSPELNLTEKKSTEKIHSGETLIERVGTESVQDENVISKAQLPSGKEQKETTNTTIYKPIRDENLDGNKFKEAPKELKYRELLDRDNTDNLGEKTGLPSNHKPLGKTNSKILQALHKASSNHNKLTSQISKDKYLLEESKPDKTIKVLKGESLHVDYPQVKHYIFKDEELPKEKKPTEVVKGFNERVNEGLLSDYPRVRDPILKGDLQDEKKLVMTANILNESVQESMNVECPRVRHPILKAPLPHGMEIYEASKGVSKQGDIDVNIGFKIELPDTTRAVSNLSRIPTEKPSYDIGIASKISYPSGPAASFKNMEKPAEKKSKTLLGDRSKTDLDAPFISFKQNSAPNFHLYDKESSKSDYLDGNIPTDTKHKIIEETNSLEAMKKNRGNEFRKKLSGKLSHKNRFHEDVDFLPREKHRNEDLSIYRGSTRFGPDGTDLVTLNNFADKISEYGKKITLELRENKLQALSKNSVDREEENYEPLVENNEIKGESNINIVNRSYIKGNKKLKITLPVPYEGVNYSGPKERMTELDGLRNLKLLSYKTEEFCKIMLELVKLFSACTSNTDSPANEYSVENLKLKQKKLQELHIAIKNLEANVKEFLEMSDSEAKNKKNFTPLSKRNIKFYSYSDQECEVNSYNDRTQDENDNYPNAGSFTSALPPPDYRTATDLKHPSDRQDELLQDVIALSKKDDFRKLLTSAAKYLSDEQDYCLEDSVDQSHLDEFRKTLLDLVFVITTSTSDKASDRTNEELKNRGQKRKRLS